MLWMQARNKPYCKFAARVAYSNTENKDSHRWSDMCDRFTVHVSVLWFCEHSFLFFFRSGVVSASKCHVLHCVVNVRKRGRFFACQRALKSAILPRSNGRSENNSFRVIIRQAEAVPSEFLLRRAFICLQGRSPSASAEKRNFPFYRKTWREIRKRSSRLCSSYCIQKETLFSTLQSAHGM